MEKKSKHCVYKSRNSIILILFHWKCLRQIQTERLQAIAIQEIVTLKRKTLTWTYVKCVIKYWNFAHQFRVYTETLISEHRRCTRSKQNSDKWSAVLLHSKRVTNNKSPFYLFVLRENFNHKKTENNLTFNQLYEQKKEMKKLDVFLLLLF